MENSALESGRAGSPTVLVVDDDPAVVEVVARIARNCGFEVLQTSSETMALELAAQSAVDLIISDVAMPKIRGPELVSQIRKAGRWCPALFLSGESDLASIDSSLSLDRAMFLPKPFSRNELVDAIWAAMKL